MAATAPQRRIDSLADAPDDRYRHIVKQFLESQAYREWTAAELMGHCVKFAPDLRLRKLMADECMEELEHYESVVELYRKEFKRDVTEVVKERLAANPEIVPMPQSWLETVMSLFLNDRAGGKHLSEYQDCSYKPYSEIVGKILEEEAGHEGFGEWALKKLVTDDATRAEAQRLFDKWLTISMRSFGRPYTEGNTYAVEMGLKRRQSDEVMREYVADIKPTMRAVGLKFPPPEQIDLELPPDLDLTV
jgi:ring-1,2-phenylacetyl-CoA epoxidase subunit PaaA